jgi:phosphocarrier protein HPr
MVSKEFIISNASGLHTRPGNDFVKTAKGFTSDITVTKGGKHADGKSLLKLMKINIIKGDCISICCEGVDETGALETLGDYLGALTE